MDILLVAATPMELLPLPASVVGRHHITVLVTGVGMMAATYALTRQLLTHSYQLVLQVGVAGSYTTNMPLGSVVQVASDGYGDLGAEDHDQFLDIYDLGLLQPNEAPHQDGRLPQPPSVADAYMALPRVVGLTVNKTSGSGRTIDLLRLKYGADIESMEGAALHYVCLQQGVEFAQVRAISNYVTPRDKSQWQMKTAITNLHHWLVTFLEALPQ